MKNYLDSLDLVDVLVIAMTTAMVTVVVLNFTVPRPPSTWSTTESPVPGLTCFKQSDSHAVVCVDNDSE